MSLIPENVCDLLNKNVLFIWGSGNSPEQLQLATDQIRAMNCSKVTMENAERLVMCKYFSYFINKKKIHFQNRIYVVFSFTPC